jgi:hypothetical protein
MRVDHWDVVAMDSGGSTTKSGKQDKLEYHGRDVMSVIVMDEGAKKDGAGVTRSAAAKLHRHVIKPSCEKSNKTMNRQP